MGHESPKKESLKDRIMIIFVRFGFGSVHWLDKGVAKEFDKAEKDRKKTK